MILQNPFSNIVALNFPVFFYKYKPFLKLVNSGTNSFIAISQNDVIKKAMIPFSFLVSDPK